MLNFFRRNNQLLLQKTIARFGGGSHDGPVDVSMDQNAKWIRYRTVLLIIMLEPKAGLCLRDRG